MAQALRLVRVREDAYVGLKKLSKEKGTTMAEVVDSFVFGFTLGMTAPFRKKSR